MSAVLTPRISPQTAAQEMLLRRQARRDPVAYAQAIEIPGAPMTDDPDETRFLPERTMMAAHHRLILNSMEWAVSTPFARLMIFTPPGASKSSMASIVYPTRYLGAAPNRRVILLSYGDDLAFLHSRRARQIARSRRYRSIYNAEPMAEAHAVKLWALSNGGEFKAAGILSGVTGNRAGLLVIDDPVKNQDDADSEPIRNRIHGEYLATAQTRLLPGAAVVIIQTRWHRDDLAGRILPEKWAGESGDIACRDGQTWRVICLQALCELPGDPLGRKPGEYLWPEWFTKQHWDVIRNNPSPIAKRVWSAMYQQVPSPEEGTYFQADWFRTWTNRPARLAVYGTSDYAVKADGGDWTVLRIWGVDPDGNIYRLGGWRGQTSSDVWVERQLDLQEQFKPACWFGELGVIKHAVSPMLTRRMRERKVFCRLEWLPSITDKPTRARGFQARAANGTVYFEQGADIGEFLAFPTGRTDDEIDAAGLLGRALDEAHPATKGEAPQNPDRRGDYEDHSDDVDLARVV